MNQSIDSAAQFQRDQFAADQPNLSSPKHQNQQSSGAQGQVRIPSLLLRGN